jgi:hypothetical protein
MTLPSVSTIFSVSGSHTNGAGNLRSTYRDLDYGLFGTSIGLSNA